MKKQTTTLIVNNERLAEIHGKEVTIETRRGVPVNREWRNRLRDAAIDNCVEIKKTTRTPKKDT